jgi:hypothetical protein
MERHSRVVLLNGNKHASKPVVAGIPCHKLIYANRLPRLSFPSKNRNNTAIFTEQFSRLRTTSALVGGVKKRLFFEKTEL